MLYVMNVVAAEAESCQKHDHHTCSSTFDKHTTVISTDGCVLWLISCFTFL